MGLPICLIAVLFFSIQVCLGTDGKPYLQTLCDDAEKCADYELSENLRRIQFLPTTEEELNTYCPPLVKAIWCIVKECVGKWSFSETASNGRIPAHKQYPYRRQQLNQGGILLEICTQGSQLRQDYLSGVSCFKNMFFNTTTNDQCQGTGYRTMESLNLTAEGATVQQRLQDTMCMSTFHALACLVAETEETCGTVASNMVHEIFKKAELITWVNCNDANMQSLKTRFLDLHLLDENRERIFSSFFES